MPRPVKIEKTIKLPKNCPRCNGPLDLKRTLGRMRMGSCEKCKRMWAYL